MVEVTGRVAAGTGAGDSKGRAAQQPTGTGESGEAVAVLFAYLFPPPGALL